MALQRARESGLVTKKVDVNTDERQLGFQTGYNLKNDNCVTPVDVYIPSIFTNHEFIECPRRLPSDCNKLTPNEKSPYKKLPIPNINSPGNITGKQIQRPLKSARDKTYNKSNNDNDSIDINGNKHNINSKSKGNLHTTTSAKSFVNMHNYVTTKSEAQSVNSNNNKDSKNYLINDKLISIYEAEK